MGLVGSIVLVAGLLVAGAVGTAAYLYTSDYKVEATVQETRCSQGEIDVKTKLFGIEHTVPDVPLQQCSLLAPGNFVEYRVKSQRTTLWDVEGGQCIYDSATGPFCGGSAAPGGPGLF